MATGTGVAAPKALAAPAYAVSSHATTFQFGALTLHCTDISDEMSWDEPSASDNRIDVTTLDVANGGERVYAPLPVTEPADGSASSTRTISVSYIGTGQPSGTAVLTMGGTAMGTWKCTRSSLARRVGQYIEGAATFVLVTPPTP